MVKIIDSIYTKVDFYQVADKAVQMNYAERNKLLGLLK